MDRRAFLTTTGTAALFSGAAARPASAFVPAHLWDGHDFGSGPPVSDRLNQGPFPTYAPEEVVPGSHVVMATTPSREIVPNYGMGLVAYVSGDIGPPRIPGEALEKSIENLVALPFVQKVYLRPDWRDVQLRPGRLDFPDYWKITFDLARQYGKRVAFRIMTENPDVPAPGMPEFLMERVPYVPLKGEWKGDPSRVRYRKTHRMPRYDHPEYQAAFEELNGLLADELNGSPLVEYMDTFMYGFWGEGHTWPFEGHPFPDDVVAEETFVRMLETQLATWTRTPLVTNTQPDYSRVGNAELLDRTVRAHNWIRTDTIFIENMQIEALSNRPPWVAAVSEIGLRTLDRLTVDQGVDINENIIAHVIDLGASYWSVWNWHDIAARNILDYYERYPEPIDGIARRIGYRVRPSWVWQFERTGHQGLVLGMVNDGIAGVPGVLRLTVLSEDGSVIVSGCLDPGHPKPQGVRQALLMLPESVDWKGLRLKAELEVKGVRHPVSWACRQRTSGDGTLTLAPTTGV
ncbi:MAG: hypothetical protein LJF30_02360 [Acidobacteria bacterium]|jgi:hypothetical protein|nr:hypothetical protein [Acidobacteriota bacterium]